VGLTLHDKIVGFARFCRLEAWMAIAILSLLARAFDAANAGAWVPVALVGLATVWLDRNAAFVHLQKG
jgi:hypothetical protein